MNVADNAVLIGFNRRFGISTVLYCRSMADCQFLTCYRAYGGVFCFAVKLAFRCLDSYQHACHHQKGREDIVVKQKVLDIGCEKIRKPVLS